MIYEELQKCLTKLSNEWPYQNNKDDQKTNFIYKCNTVDEVIKYSNYYHADLNYALHRWYNFQTSIQVEQIFCTLGAIKEKNKYHHDIDIYVQNTPFDVKLTVYPSKLNHIYDVTTREGKNQLINWFYNNQSKENRKQIVNRLYVVVDGKNNLALKSNKDLIYPRIYNYMAYTNKYGLNQLFIKLDGNFYKIFSDLIYVTD